MDIYLNGKMLSPDKPTLSAGDAGFTHAVGLFETMAATHGRVFRLDAHLDRLIQSAKQLGLSPQIDKTRLADAVIQTLTHNNLTEARLRLTITAGNVSLLRPDPDQPPVMTELVTAEPSMQYDPAYFEQGIKVLIAPPGANPFDALAGHKTLAYWNRLRTLRQAAAAGAGEAIWLNISNHLASGSVSNIFLVKNDQLFTPIARGQEVDGALPAPVLPGITRAAIIEIAQSLNITVNQQMLDVNDLLEADEVFLTISSWQVLPVTSIEKKTIQDGNIGPLTQQLREALLKLIQKETTKSNPP